MDKSRVSMSQCARCIFKMANRQACVAFPRGIPPLILSGQVDHALPQEGDGGIRFIPLHRTSAVDPFPPFPPLR